MLLVPGGRAWRAGVACGGCAAAHESIASASTSCRIPISLMLGADAVEHAQKVGHADRLAQILAHPLAKCLVAQPGLVVRAEHDDIRARPALAQKRRQIEAVHSR